MFSLISQATLEPRPSGELSGLQAAVRAAGIVETTVSIDKRQHVEDVDGGR